jgi:hypothetical protein
MHPVETSKDILTESLERFLPDIARSEVGMEGQEKE